MVIESVIRMEITATPGDLGQQCLRSVHRKGKLVQDRGNTVISTLVSHVTTITFMIMSFVFHVEKDPYKLR